MTIDKLRDRRHAHAHGRDTADAIAPGKRTLAETLTAPTAKLDHDDAAVEIAPDLRDHSKPPVLGAALDVELRTLVAHVRRNLARYATSTTTPERDAALDAVDTRAELAFGHIPDAQRDVFRAELERELGPACVDELCDAATTVHGARAVALFGLTLVEKQNDQRDPIQLDAEDDSAAELSPDAAHAIAAHGTDSGAGELPHADAIQSSFGHHDIHGVRAHVGGAAREASAALGARAYASGDAVAFASAPDLRLAAHEAAHVVQQRGGVRLASAVGAAGDAYERHADAVADLVVRGESAQGLLDQYAHRGSSGGAAIQRVAEPRPQIRAVIDALPTAADAAAVVTQLSVLHPTARDGAREYTITIGRAHHTIAGRDVRFLLARARHRSTALAPAIAPIAADASATSRTVLVAAVERARDIGELETARDSILALGATPPNGVHEVALASASYAVGAPDLAWVLQQVESRLRAVQSISGDLVDTRVAVGADTFSQDPALAPAVVAPAHDDADEMPFGFHAGLTIPTEWEIETPFGRVCFEFGVETQVYAGADEHEQRIGVEVPSVLGLGAHTGGHGHYSPLARGGGVGVTGVARTLVETAVHHRFDTAGHDFIRIERRDGHVEGALGWNFPPIHTRQLDVGFEFTLAELSVHGLGSRLRVPVTTEWWNITDHLRARALGAVSITLDYAAVGRAVSNLMARAATTTAADTVATTATTDTSLATATSTTADTSMVMTSSTTVDTGMAMASTTADTSIAMASTDAAAGVVVEETFGAALLAAGETGLALMGPLALVGVFAVAVLTLALLGYVLAEEAGGDAPRERRRRGPNPMSRFTADAALTTFGSGIHVRIRAFCLAYADMMRGASPRTTGHGADAGTRAACDWMRELESEGHSIADIRAAARSSPDLEARALANARSGFEALLDAQVDGAVWHLYRVGMGDGEYTQRCEWMTRHLHACISLDAAAPPSPEFRFDPCRSLAHDYDDQIVDDRYQPFDRTACPPGESDPDAPNPASGTDAEPIAEQ